jgi:hypothetical protein
MLFAIGILFGLMTVALVVIIALLFLMERTLTKMAIQVSDLVTQVATVSADFDAYVAAQPVPTPPVDLQPVADALTALDGKIKLATPAPTTAPATA